ncbi:RNA polymerase primary sigma factor [Flavobacterium sp. 28A]|uniref:sigma factor n=1 Tax=Flavobacterium sp. 28A TaxID=2735895 RepID=UPI00156ECB7A|nr:sigma factor [Flavobacterium sp. 28A]NRT16976.1 RNA polymerase primary sigma factor [Flavobacterium sp. 28A]
MRKLEINKKQSETEEEVAVNNYLQQIEKFTSLTDTEEIELILLIKTGDQKAHEKLVRANLHFVVSIASEFVDKGVSFQDLINEGNLALINSAKCFDVTHEVTFRYYLDRSIRNYLAQALTEQKIVRLPKHPVLGSMSKFGKSIMNLKKK